MNRMEEAKKLHEGGFNCAQSVLAVFCENYGLDRETALKISAGFGGGMRCGEVCGAATGALMVIGLKEGHYRENDAPAKQFCYRKTVEFMDVFRKRHGSLLCRDLLSCDISTPEGMEEAAGKNLFATRCMELIQSAISILEELGY